MGGMSAARKGLVFARRMERPGQPPVRGVLQTSLRFALRYRHIGSVPCTECSPSTSPCRGHPGASTRERAVVLPGPDADVSCAKTDEFEFCKLPTSLLELADASGLNRMLWTLPWLVRSARAIPVFDRQWSCQFCRINRMIFTSVRWPTAGLSRGSIDHERLSSSGKCVHAISEPAPSMRTRKKPAETYTHVRNFTFAI